MGFLMATTTACVITSIKHHQKDQPLGQSSCLCLPHLLTFLNERYEKWLSRHSLQNICSKWRKYMWYEHSTHCLKMHTQAQKTCITQLTSLYISFVKFQQSSYYRQSIWHWHISFHFRMLIMRSTSECIYTCSRRDRANLRERVRER